MGKEKFNVSREHGVTTTKGEVIEGWWVVRPLERDQRPFDVRKEYPARLYLRLEEYGKPELTASDIVIQKIGDTKKTKIKKSDYFKLKIDAFNKKYFKE